MKTKILRKKLMLVKETVAHLDTRSMGNVRAGNAPATDLDCSEGPHCGVSSQLSAWIIDGMCMCPTEYWPLC